MVDVLIRKQFVTTSTIALTVTTNQICYVRVKHVLGLTVTSPTVRQSSPIAYELSVNSTTDLLRAIRMLKLEQLQNTPAVSSINLQLISINITTRRFANRTENGRQKFSNVNQSVDTWKHPFRLLSMAFTPTSHFHGTPHSSFERMANLCSPVAGRSSPNQLCYQQRIVFMQTMSQILELSLGSDTATLQCRQMRFSLKLSKFLVSFAIHFI